MEYLYREDKLLISHHSYIYLRLQIRESCNLPPRQRGERVLIENSSSIYPFEAARIVFLAGQGSGRYRQHDRYPLTRDVLSVIESASLASLTNLPISHPWLRMTTEFAIRRSRLMDLSVSHPYTHPSPVSHENSPYSLTCTHTRTAWQPISIQGAIQRPLVIKLFRLPGLER